MIKPNFGLIDTLETCKRVSVKTAGSGLVYKFRLEPIVEGVKAYRVYFGEDGAEREIGFFRDSDHKLIVRKRYAHVLPKPFISLDNAIQGFTDFEASIDET